MTKRIATGFDLGPLPDGSVLVEFFGDDGETFNSQVVTKAVVESMPTVASLMLVYLERGLGEVKRLMQQQEGDQ